MVQHSGKAGCHMRVLSIKQVKGMSKGTYERRKAAGLCVNCGTDKNVEGVRCVECKKKVKKEKAEWRMAYINARVCPDCRKNSLIGSRTYCFECREKKIIRSRKYTETHKEQKKEYEKRFKAEKIKQGLCIKCGKRKTINGKKWCETCLAKQKQIMADKRAKTTIPRSMVVSLGYCYICYKPLDREGKLCKKCAEMKTSQIIKYSKPNENWKRQNELIKQG